MSSGKAQTTHPSPPSLMVGRGSKAGMAGMEKKKSPVPVSFSFREVVSNHKNGKAMGKERWVGAQGQGKAVVKTGGNKKCSPPKAKVP